MGGGHENVYFVKMFIFSLCIKAGMSCFRVGMSIPMNLITPRFAYSFFL